MPSTSTSNHGMISIFCLTVLSFFLLTGFCHAADKESANPDHLEKLRTIQSMKDEGLISIDEFNSLRARILENITSPARVSDHESSQITAVVKEKPDPRSLTSKSVRIAIIPPMNLDDPGASGWLFRELLQEFQNLYPNEQITFTGYSDILRSLDKVLLKKGSLDLKQAGGILDADILLQVSANNLTVNEHVELQDDLKTQISSGALVNLDFTFYGSSVKSAGRSPLRSLYHGTMRRRYAAMAPAETLCRDLYPRVARFILARFKKKHSSLKEFQSLHTSTAPAAQVTGSEKQAPDLTEKQESTLSERLKTRLKALKGKKADKSR